jgi:hypothetical protein
MDLRRRQTEHSTAVPLDWGFALGLVLRAGTGDHRESAIDANDRRTIHAYAILRSPEDDLVARATRLRRESETRASTDAVDGAGSDLSQATAFESGAESIRICCGA